MVIPFFSTDEVCVLTFPITNSMIDLENPDILSKPKTEPLQVDLIDVPRWGPCNRILLIPAGARKPTFYLDYTKYMTMIVSAYLASDYDVNFQVCDMCSTRTKASASASTIMSAFSFHRSSESFYAELGKIADNYVKYGMSSFISRIKRRAVNHRIITLLRQRVEFLMD